MKKLIKTELLALAEIEYRDFSQKLLPTTEGIIGVRLPKLRKLAKKIIKEDWRRYLEDSPEYFEEKMLQGMIIGYLNNVTVTERCILIQKFLPKIDNWSTCDSFCSGLKFTKNHQADMWTFLEPYDQDSREYYVRFAVVMLLNYYINKEYIDKVLKRLNSVKHEGYYAKMAVAWAISICFIKFPVETMTFLKKNELDDFTYHKSLQKIRESSRISQEVKVLIGMMKR